MGLFTRSIWIAILAAAAVPGNAQKVLTTREAKNHIGEQARVCGTVASTHYSARTKGQPTFINLDKADKAYPEQIFTIVIWGEDRPKFGAPESLFANKRVCATGVITMYRNAPEIIVHEPRQIESQD